MDELKISVHVYPIGDHHLLMRVNDHWSLYNLKEVDPNLLDEDIQKLKLRLLKGE